MMKKPEQIMLVGLATALLVACGGDGGSGGSAAPDTNSDPLRLNSASLEGNDSEADGVVYVRATGAPFYMSADVSGGNVHSGFYLSVNRSPTTGNLNDTLKIVGVNCNTGFAGRCQNGLVRFECYFDTNNKVKCYDADKNDSEVIADIDITTLLSGNETKVFFIAKATQYFAGSEHSEEIYQPVIFAY